MKFFVLALLLLASEALAAEVHDEIDWSQVLPREQEPGFWDDFDENLRPAPVDVRSRRIIGGWEVVPNSHPYAVFILVTRPNGIFRCGASIISRFTILTAAHCVDGTSQTQAIAGAHDIRTTEPTQQRHTIPLSAYRIHPLYSRSPLSYDIAILNSAAAYTETQFVRFSRLPNDFRNEIFDGELVTVVGWGQTCATCPTSPVLRGVQNTIITNAACRTFYGSTITDQFFCMQTTGQRGTCPGDSGGPYTLPRPGPADQLPVIQIGVHSFGASSAVGGCEAQMPSGAVRTTFFLDWIEANMIR